MPISITSVYRQLFGKTDLRGGTVIDMAEHGRAGGVSSEQGFKYIRDVDEKVLIDEVDASTTYIGKAKIGTATSAESWQIKKLSKSGTVTTAAFAGGTDNYDQIWDNRASLSYS